MQNIILNAIHEYATEHWHIAAGRRCPECGGFVVTARAAPRSPPPLLAGFLGRHRRTCFGDPWMPVTSTGMTGEGDDRIAGMTGEGDDRIAGMSPKTPVPGGHGVHRRFSRLPPCRGGEGG